MRYGDKDGFDDIYDDKGELILHPNEKVLVKEENVVPSLKSTWRYYGGNYLLEPSKGNLYLTNERMVFINTPESMFAIGASTEESRAMSTPKRSTFELGDLTSGASMREFFEIPNIEIMASELKEGTVSVGEMVNIYILSSGNQYHLSSVLAEDSDLLIRLMNKKVENLDELVNNLKDFFRKTDWMFRDGEKKVYSSSKNTQGPDNLPPYDSGDASLKEPSPPVEKESPTNHGLTMASHSVPKRRIPISEEVGNKSREYFKNLFKKGLIKEEIYGKLMAQYGEVKGSQPSRGINPPKDEDSAGPILVPKNPQKTEKEEKNEPTGDDGSEDSDLLDMLDSTLFALDGDYEDPEEDTASKTESEVGTEEEIPVQKPIKAKKVHRRK